MDEKCFERKKYEIFQLLKIIPDFPYAGLTYCDIMPIFETPETTKTALDLIVHELSKKKWKFDIIVGIEARGFLLGVPLAERLNVAFCSIRKAGKIPGKVIQVSFEKENGDDVLEIQQSNNLSGKRVIIFDDILATGSTTVAALELLKKTGSIVVGCAYLLNVASVKKVQKLKTELCYPLE